MAKLIRHGRIVIDDWTQIAFVAHTPVKKQAGKIVELKLTGAASANASEIAAIEVPAGKVLIPLALWLARREELAARLASGTLGVWLDSFEEPEALAASVEDLNQWPVIGVNFPKFTDGRGYSIARLLRDRFGYRNELRAVGEVLRDQLFYMRRCGFDVYAVRDPETALTALTDFTESYQGAADEPRPLYRRHRYITGACP